MTHIHIHYFLALMINQPCVLQCISFNTKNGCFVPLFSATPEYPLLIESYPSSPRSDEKSPIDADVDDDDDEGGDSQVSDGGESGESVRGHPHHRHHHGHNHVGSRGSRMHHASGGGGSHRGSREDVCYDRGNGSGSRTADDDEDSRLSSIKS